MVASFHEAGLEVILDVVYNHTAEGNERGPTLSFKGIDNASYYRLLPEKRYYINDTGTGNTVNLSHPNVIEMVTDSLRYWVNELHIDGFRFDLGTILAREPNGFDNQSGFLKVCHQDPVLRTVKLIAEPWDCGPGGYQVGGFPPGWAEWNDRYRDTVRDYWKGACVGRASGAATVRLRRYLQPLGPPTLGQRQLRHGPRRLHAERLVTYNDKHNEANGEDNATAAATIAPGTAAPRGRPRMRRSMPCASARSATSWPHCCCPRARRCSWPAMNSGARSRATTTPTARTMRSAGSTGTGRQGPVAAAVRAEAVGAARQVSDSAPQPLSDRQPMMKSWTSRI